MRRSLPLGLLLLTPALALAAPEPEGRKEEPHQEALSTRQRELKLGEETLAYTSTTGRLLLRDWDGKAKAQVFFVAYTRDPEEGAPPRPITFAFNGGPGSSAVWLHLGALGPRRVLYGDEGEPLGPPFRLVDNEATWLAFTDLVFIDPVTTGYSRPVEGEQARQFHGLQEDITWVGEFIRTYVGRYQRWDSPKFLVGESYGTTRAAGLAAHLQDALGMYLNGVLLVSPVLDFQTIRFDPGNDMPYWLYLPSYTAVALFHGRLARELQADPEATLAEAETWARTEYLQALARGSDLPPADEHRVATRLARYTGLPVEVALAARLRISGGLFMKELLRGQGKVVGRFDGRYTGDDPQDVGAHPGYDPSYAVIQGAFTGAFNAYVRAELGYESDRPYEILTGRVHPWSFPGDNRYVTVADDLRGAMTRNPALHVLVAAGYYDLATPYFAADYTVSHLGLEPEQRARVSQTYYEAGHMMYLRREDLLQLGQDAAEFYGKALGR